MRQVILKDAPAKVDFIPEDPGPFNDRITAEQRAGRVTVSLIGGLHGDFAPFVQAEQLEDLTPLMNKLGDRGFPRVFVLPCTLNKLLDRRALERRRLGAAAPRERARKKRTCRSQRERNVSLHQIARGLHGPWQCKLRARESDLARRLLSRHPWTFVGRRDGLRRRRW